jgi:hypothetical protein
MPSYQIEFVGGGVLSRSSVNVICADDHQALHRASDLLAHHLGAEVSSDGMQVGWVTTAENQATSA